MKNVAHLCSLDGSKTWDDNGWNKVVICIIADGRNEVNKQTLQLLSKVRPEISVLSYQHLK